MSQGTEISERVHESRLKLPLLIVEIAVLALLLIFDKYVPVSRTPYLFVMGWISLRLRGLRWRDVGLRAPDRWARALTIGVIAGVGMELLELGVTQPLISRFTGRGPDLELFRSVHGNPKVFAIYVVLAWILAGFGEETVWRGYLMNRVAGVLEGSPARWIISLVLVSAVFGVAHMYQGVTGIIDEALMGAILGAIYLASGRNLWAPIIAHGLADTIDLLLMYSGKFPGM